MEDRLIEIKKRNDELESLISKPETIADQKLYKELTMEHSKIAPLINKYELLNKTRNELKDTMDLLVQEKEQEMRELLKLEIQELEEKTEIIEKELLFLMLPKDPNIGKDILIEIRAGTGGEEAALFARELYRMYSRYIDINGWNMDVISANTTGIDGLKEIIFSVVGTLCTLWVPDSYFKFP